MSAGTVVVAVVGGDLEAVAVGKRLAKETRLDNGGGCGYCWCHCYHC